MQLLFYQFKCMLIFNMLPVVQFAEILPRNWTFVCIQVQVSLVTRPMFIFNFYQTVHSLISHAKEHRSWGGFASQPRKKNRAVVNIFGRKWIHKAPPNVMGNESPTLTVTRFRSMILLCQQSSHIINIQRHVLKCTVTQVMSSVCCGWHGQVHCILLAFICN